MEKNIRACRWEGELGNADFSHDGAAAFIDSQQLWLPAKNLDKIKSIKLRGSGFSVNGS